MTLDILIAQYKETEEVIKPMLDSIALQQGINFKDIRVVIANDGSDTILSDKFLNQYNYKIEYYKKEHKGLSHTRNFLLDKATADYIIFCDADDMFLYNHAINIIFSIIKKCTLNCIFPKFMVEVKHPNGETSFHPWYECHVHGKVLRRQFLLDNEIRWKDELVKHDSRYFFTICEAVSPQDKIVRYEQPYYLWKYNEKSLTRSTEDWNLDTYEYFTYSVECLIDELFRRELKSIAETSIISFLYLTYFLCGSEIWLKESNKEKVKKVLKRVSTFYKKYENCSSELNEETHAQLVNFARNQIQSKQTTPVLQKMSFIEWLSKLN